LGRYRPDCRGAAAVSSDRGSSSGSDGPVPVPIRAPTSRSSSPVTQPPDHC
jgi:hypothetical protein